MRTNQECYHCWEVKPLTEFFPTNLNQCKACLAAKRKARVALAPAKHKAKQAANARKYRAKLAKKHAAGVAE